MEGGQRLVSVDLKLKEMFGSRKRFEILISISIEIIFFSFHFELL